jgi:PTS system nitrogen regulatory IIA component
MARSGEIPATRIGRVWRFDEDVVLEWFNRRLRGEARSEGNGSARPHHLWNGTTRVAALLNEETVQYTAERKKPREVLEALAALAVRTRHVHNYEGLLESLLERESMCPTALEGGVAFPHPRQPVDKLERPVLALLVARHGVKFGAPDEQPTRVFVLVCSPDDRTHVKVLSHLARLFRRPSSVGRLTRNHTTDGILRELERLETRLIENSHHAGEGVK